VDLNALLSDDISMPPPTEIGMTLHWLAVDGTPTTAPINPLDDDHKIPTDGGDEEQRDTSVAIRQLLPRLVSDELQLYFTRITDTLSSTSSQYPEAAITRLASDKCIQELIPFIIQYITRNIHQNMKNVEQCRLMIRCVDALIRNSHVHLELHLHQLLGPVLSCIVAKTIGSSSLMSDNQDDPYSHENKNHWILRDEASDVLARICFTYGDKYKNLQGSVLKTLCKALEYTSYDFLGSWYGGIVGITKFGVKAVDAFLLPLMGYTMIWEDALDQDEVDSLSRRNRNIRYALHRCQDALLYAMAIYMEKMEELDPSSRLDYDKYSEVFGDKLTPFYNRMSMDYSTCFV
jgi:transcription initiation factor TFIID subunit 6